MSADVQLRLIDEAMSARIRPLDSDNNMPSGVVMTSVKHAHELIGHGRVASAFAELRPGVNAVDVDLAGAEGLVATCEVVEWLKGTDFPYLVRPSGGDSGRHHVFVVVGNKDGLKALNAATKMLRRRFKAARTQIEVRGAVRLLTAPHRETGRCPAPWQGEAEREAFLRAVELLPRHDPPGRRRPKKTHRPNPDQPKPTSLPRAHACGMPGQFQAWLEGTGPRPTLRGENSQSAIEAAALAHIMRTGVAYADAWGQISTVYAEKLPRMAADESRVQFTWNRARDHDELFRRVIELDRCGLDAPSAHEYLREHAPHLLAYGDREDPEVFATVWEELLTSYRNHLHERGLPEGGRRREGHEIRAELRGPYEDLLDLLGRLPKQVRPSRFEVGWWLICRANREDSMRVPCPVRDIEVDSGLSRKTVSAALKDLHAAGWGVRHESFLPDGTGTPSNEFEIASSQTGVRRTPPPGLHRPHGLGPPSRHLLLHHLLHHRPLRLDDPQLHLLTGNPSPTTSQRRTLTAELTELATAGLATCDANARWRPASEPTAAAVRAREAERQDRLERVRIERALYRRQCPSARWNRERREALIACRARARAWFASLTWEEQNARRRDRRARFASLPFGQQRRWIERWDTRDAICGLPSPAERHQAWLDQQAHNPRFADECAARAHEFARLPRPERSYRSQAWAMYRQRHEIPEPLRNADAVLPEGVLIRDDEYLHREAAAAQAQLPGLSDRTG